MVTYKINSDVLRGYGDYAAAGKRKEFKCPEQQGQVQNSLPNRKITTVDATEFTREVLVELGYMDKESSQKMDLKGLRKFVNKLDGKFGQISPEIKNTLSNALTDEQSLDKRSIFSVLGEIDKLNRLVEDDNMLVTEDDFVVIENNTESKQMKVFFAEKEDHITYEKSGETVNLTFTEKLDKKAGLCQWAAGVFDQYVQYKPIYDNLLVYDRRNLLAGEGNEEMGAYFTKKLANLFGKTCIISLKDMRKMVTGTRRIKDGGGSAAISKAYERFEPVGNDVKRKRYSHYAVNSLCLVLVRLKQVPNASVSDFKKILNDLHIRPREKMDDVAMGIVLERLKAAAAEMKEEALTNVPNLGDLYDEDGVLLYQDPDAQKFDDSHVNHDLTKVEWSGKSDYLLPPLFPLGKEINEIDDLDVREQKTGEHFKEQIELTLGEVEQLSEQLSKEEDIEIDQAVLGVFRDFLTTHAELVKQMKKFENGEFDYTTKGGKKYVGNSIKKELKNDVRHLDYRELDEVKAYEFGEGFSSELEDVMGEKGLYYKTEQFELWDDTKEIWHDRILDVRRKERKRRKMMQELSPVPALTDDEIRSLYIDGVKEKCKRAVGDHNAAVMRFFNCWRSASDVQQKKQLLRNLSQVRKVDGKVSLDSLISRLASWEFVMQLERGQKLKAEEKK